MWESIIAKKKSDEDEYLVSLSGTRILTREKLDMLAKILMIDLKPHATEPDILHGSKED